MKRVIIVKNKPVKGYEGFFPRWAEIVQENETVPDKEAEGYPCSQCGCRTEVLSINGQIGNTCWTVRQACTGCGNEEFV